jgi:hypothetical protein
MARLFVSYARQDRAFVARLAAALEREGHKVWWDRALTPGERFAGEIELALDGADQAIVVWSKSAAASDWVRDEATRARAAGKLIPVQIESNAIPLGFGALHTIDMSRFRGALTDPGMAELLRAAHDGPSAIVPRPRTGLVSLLVRAAGLGLIPATTMAGTAAALQVGPSSQALDLIGQFLVFTGPAALGLGATSAVRLARLGLKSTGALARDMIAAWAMGATGALAIAAVALVGEPDLIAHSGLAGLGLMVALASLGLGALIGIGRALWAFLRRA